MKTCPACGRENNDSEIMCNYCGEDLDNVMPSKNKGFSKRRPSSNYHNNSSTINEDFLIVEQQMEWLETFTSFETQNRYAILNRHGQELFFAEEKSSFLSRLFLTYQRPLNMEIYNNYGDFIMAMEKPFRFFIPEMIIYDSDKREIGSIKKKFWALRRTFLVYDVNGNEIFKIIGPIFHPWTFNIIKNGQELGRISKKWSGMGKEMFTDADTFTIQFPQNATDEEKKIFLGATFLIDYIYFENKK